MVDSAYTVGSGVLQHSHGAFTDCMTEEAPCTMLYDTLILKSEISKGMSPCSERSHCETSAQRSSPVCRAQLSLPFYPPPIALLTIHRSEQGYYFTFFTGRPKLLFGFVVPSGAKQ